MALSKASPDNHFTDRLIIDIWSKFLAAVPDLRDQEAMDAVRGDRYLFSNLRRVSTRTHGEWLNTLPSTLRGGGNQPSRPGQPTLAQWIHLRAILDDTFEDVFGVVLWVLARDMSEFYGSKPSRLQAMDQYGKECVHQLMGIWNVCMAKELFREKPGGLSLRHFLLDQVSQPSSVDWTFLAESGEDTGGTLNERLSFLFGGTRRHPIAAVLATLHLLRTIERQPWGPEFVLQYQPWMRLMGSVIDRPTQKLEGGDPQRAPQSIVRILTSPEVDIAVRGHWQTLLESFRFEPVAADITTTIPPGSGTAHRSAEGTHQHDLHASNSETFDPALESSSAVMRPSNDVALRDRFTRLSIVRLGRCVEQENVTSTERVRQDVLQFNARNPQIQLPVQVYEHLLLAFLSLKRLDPAMECWKMMVKAGHPPSVKTYTIAIQYSQHLKTHDAVDYFWNAMRQDGLQPDGHAWNFRLTNLFRRNDVDYGMRALAQMGDEWINAARRAYGSQSKKTKKGVPPPKQDILFSAMDGDINGVPKPTAYTLNAAIKALAKKKNDEVITKILAWGRKFDIEPDVYTYNSLIHMSMVKGAPGEAMQILRRMGDKGVKANDDTWTVLLNAMFKNLDFSALKPEEQESKLLTLIKSLEGATGETLGPKGYAIVLDRLLKMLNNPRAAQAVLQHMTTVGAELTQFHYTVLLTHYFQQQPPDFASIEALWNRIETGQNGYAAALGVQFYDRMIEGYATNHRTLGIVPMMAFIKHAHAEGKYVSWPALSQAVRALAESGEWNVLSQLVNDVRQGLKKREIGIIHGGSHYNFWRLVISTGVLSREGITEPEQINEENMGSGRDAYNTDRRWGKAMGERVAM